jgi:GDP-mannose transporter
MILFNKLTMHHLPYPSLVSIVQFGLCTLVILVLKHGGYIECDALDMHKIKPYMVYNLAFVVSIYANMKALEGSNVDTVIVFRSCVPLALSILEWMFMNRELPDLRSALALGMILLGATGYVFLDSAFKLNGWAAYSWLTTWTMLLCFLMVFGKMIVDQVTMQSMWGNVYYTNCLSIVPMMCLGLSGEAQTWANVQMTSRATVFLALSSLVGIGLSYTGWECRGALSATTYGLVGLMCKLLPATVNALIWDKHASLAGGLCLVVCLMGGAMYKQAPLRPEVKTAKSPLDNLPETSPCPSFLHEEGEQKTRTDDE